MERLDSLGGEEGRRRTIFYEGQDERLERERERLENERERRRAVLDSLRRSREGRELGDTTRRPPPDTVDTTRTRRPDTTRVRPDTTGPRRDTTGAPPDTNRVLPVLPDTSGAATTAGDPRTGTTRSGGGGESGGR